MLDKIKGMVAGVMAGGASQAAAKALGVDENVLNFIQIPDNLKAIVEKLNLPEDLQTKIMEVLGDKVDMAKLLPLIQENGDLKDKIIAAAKSMM